MANSRHFGKRCVFELVWVQILRQKLFPFGLVGDLRDPGEEQVQVWVRIQPVLNRPGFPRDGFLC